MNVIICLTKSVMFNCVLPLTGKYLVKKSMCSAFNAITIAGIMMSPTNDCMPSFAARAMQGFVDEVGCNSDQKWFDEIADGAYRMADAMLKVREETDPE